MNASNLFRMDILRRGSILLNLCDLEMFRSSFIQKVVFIFAFCLTTQMGYCQNLNDDENLYLFTKLTNEAAVFSLDEISKITFSKKGIQIWNTNWPTEYPYSNVRVLTFNDRESLLQTKVESAGRIVADIDITYNSSSFTLAIACGQVLKGVAIYNAIGVIVLSDMDPKSGYYLNLSGLPEGVYIVKAFGDGRIESKKIVK